MTACSTKRSSSLPATYRNALMALFRAGGRMYLFQGAFKGPGTGTRGTVTVGTARMRKAQNGKKG